MRAHTKKHSSGMNLTVVVFLGELLLFGESQEHLF